ncbi:metallophosphoesterase [Meridianimarinicoccus sp. RP-17]|uniref:metallophosphoesterase n=1 Tax=Meridianimarinicoccus zhengii TaxID=2056810 RepID=UPI000DABEE0E|nr:metallophosphoesterase [Phycocomes zhengii]
MFAKLFGRSADKKRTTTTFDAQPEPDAKVLAVGDIHGRDDLLARLLDRIAADDPGVPLVFLGDYVDRGEHSAAVLRRVAGLADQWSGPVIALMGNHERMMLDFIDTPEDSAGRWLRNGGLQTLASFSVGCITDQPTPDDARDAADRLRGAMGGDLIAWLGGLPLQHASGNVHFVHAAADPSLPMAAQEPRTLLWGHPAFAATPREDGQFVVHGHTVVDAPAVTAGRVAVDTGAWFTGRLTAARIAPGEIGFMSC